MKRQSSLHALHTVTTHIVSLLAVSFSLIQPAYQKNPNRKEKKIKTRKKEAERESKRRETQREKESVSREGDISFNLFLFRLSQFCSAEFLHNEWPFVVGECFRPLSLNVWLLIDLLMIWWNWAIAGFDIF